MIDVVREITQLLRQNTFNARYGNQSHVLIRLPRDGKFVLSRENQLALHRRLWEWIPLLYDELTTLCGHPAFASPPAWHGSWAVEDAIVDADPNVVYSSARLSTLWDYAVADREHAITAHLAPWMGLAECIRGNKPFLLDIDLKYTTPVNTALFYNREDIVVLVHLLQRFLKANILGNQVEDDLASRERYSKYVQSLLGGSFTNRQMEDLFTVIVLEKPPYVAEDGVTVKRGLHLHAPFLYFFTTDLQRVLLPAWVQFVANEHEGQLHRLVGAVREAKGDLSLSDADAFSQMFDVLGTSSNWLVYGCTKSVHTLPYLATSAFGGNGQRLQFIRDAFVERDADAWKVCWFTPDAKRATNGFLGERPWWAFLPSLLSVTPERGGMLSLPVRVDQETDFLSGVPLTEMHDAMVDMEDHEQTWEPLVEYDAENGDSVSLREVADTWVEQLGGSCIRGVQNPTYAAFVWTHLPRILDELISADYATNRADWIHMGVILHSLVPDRKAYAHQLWLQFSQRSLRDNVASPDLFRHMRRWIESRPLMERPWSAMYACIQKSCGDAQLRMWYKAFKSDEQSALRSHVTHMFFARRLWQHASVFKNVMLLGTKRYVFIQDRHCWIEDDSNVHMMQMVLRDNLLSQLFEEHLTRLRNLTQEHQNDAVADYLKQCVSSWQKQRSRIENIDFIQKTLRSMDVLAAPRVHLLPSMRTELDSNPLLLGVRNGVLDLQTFELRPGAPADMITMQVECEYHDFDPLHPISVELMQIVSRTFVDPATREIFLEHIARMLFGVNWHKKVYHWTGSGDGGKTVLQSMVESLLGGDMCISRDAGLLTEKMGTTGGATPHIVDLFNKRAVFMYEPDNDMFYKNGSLKMFSGGDRIRGRGLYENKYTSRVITFTPVVVCNDIPRLRADDYASWERIAIFPFLSRFRHTDVPESAAEQLQTRMFPRDMTLNSRVSEFAPYFLALLVRVLREGKWRSFRESPEMVNARQQYERNNDVVQIMMTTKVRVTDRPNTVPEIGAVHQHQVVTFEMLRSMYAHFKTQYRYGRNSSLTDPQLLRALVAIIGSEPHPPQHVWYNLEIVESEFFA